MGYILLWTMRFSIKLRIANFMMHIFAFLIKSYFENYNIFWGIFELLNIGQIAQVYGFRIT